MCAPTFQERLTCCVRAAIKRCHAVGRVGKTSCVVKILAGVVAIGAFAIAPAIHEQGRAALEFFVRPGITVEIRHEIALSLWESGVVERVDAPRGGSAMYRLFLDEPTNLLHMQEAHVRLGDLCAVFSVMSLAGWLMPKDRHHPGCPPLVIPSER